MQGQADTVDTILNALGAPSSLGLLTATDGLVADIELTLRGEDGVWTSDQPEVTQGKITVPLDRVIALRMFSMDLVYEMEFVQLDLRLTVFPGRFEVVFVQFHAPGAYIGTRKSACGTAGGRLEINVLKAL